MVFHIPRNLKRKFLEASEKVPINGEREHTPRVFRFSQRVALENMALSVSKIFYKPLQRTCSSIYTAVMVYCFERKNNMQYLVLLTAY